MLAEAELLCKGEVAIVGGPFPKGSTVQRSAEVGHLSRSTEARRGSWTAELKGPVLGCLRSEEQLPGPIFTPILSFPLDKWWCSSPLLSDLPLVPLLAEPKGATWGSSLRPVLNRIQAHFTGPSRGGSTIHSLASSLLLCTLSLPEWGLHRDS